MSVSINVSKDMCLGVKLKFVIRQLESTYKHLRPRFFCDESGRKTKLSSPIAH